MTFYTPKTEYDFFGKFCHFHTFVYLAVIFHYFYKWIEMHFNISIDILQVKIKQFFTNFEKRNLLMEKIHFPFTFTFAVGKNLI